MYLETLRRRYVPGTAEAFCRTVLSGLGLCFYTSCAVTVLLFYPYTGSVARALEMMLPAVLSVQAVTLGVSSLLGRFHREFSLLQEPAALVLGSSMVLFLPDFFARRLFEPYALDPVAAMFLVYMLCSFTVAVGLIVIGWFRLSPYMRLLPSFVSGGFVLSFVLYLGFWALRAPPDRTSFLFLEIGTMSFGLAQLLPLSFGVLLFSCMVLGKNQVLASVLLIACSALICLFLTVTHPPILAALERNNLVTPMQFNYDIGRFFTLTTLPWDQLQWSVLLSGPILSTLVLAWFCSHNRAEALPPQHYAERQHLQASAGAENGALMGHGLASLAGSVVGPGVATRYEMLTLAAALKKLPIFPVALALSMGMFVLAYVLLPLSERAFPLFLVQAWLFAACFTMASHWIRDYFKAASGVELSLMVFLALFAFFLGYPLALLAGLLVCTLAYARVLSFVQPVRLRFTGRWYHSTSDRTLAESRYLKAQGERLQGLILQNWVQSRGLGQVLGAYETPPDTPPDTPPGGTASGGAASGRLAVDYFVLDLSRVLYLSDQASGLIGDFIQKYGRASEPSADSRHPGHPGHPRHPGHPGHTKRIFFVIPGSLPGAPTLSSRACRKWRTLAQRGVELRFCDTLNEALEASEDAILNEKFTPHLEPDLETILERHIHEPDLRMRLLSILPQRHFEKGEVLIAQGACSDHLMLVEEGGIRVIFSGEKIQNLPIRRARAGAIVGELAFALGVRRDATVVATEPTKVRALHREIYYKIRAQNPELHTALLDLILASLSQALVRSNQTLQQLQNVHHYEQFMDLPPLLETPPPGESGGPGAGGG